MGELDGKVALVTGGAQNIGRAICLELAAAGAHVLVNTRRSVEIAQQTVDMIAAAGGTATVAEADITDPAAVDRMVAQGVAAHGGIDILVNNASAISLTNTVSTPMKRYDLMNQVNARGTFACSQACIPHLAKAENPHILNLSPPLNMEARWFSGHVAYTMAKYGMSMCVLGMAEELAPQGIAVNALWPKTVIATAAVQNLLGGDATVNRSRKPDIVADAAHAILTRPSKTTTGNFFIDEEVLRQEGVTDFDAYAHAPGHELLPDFFI